MVAIMENFQTKDGHVNIPNVLQKYMGKKTI
jgi:seryl-tRNA synthetase